MASIIGVSTGSPAYGFRPRGTLISLSLCVFFSLSFYPFLSLSHTHTFFVLLFLFFFFFVRIIEQRNAVDGKREARGCVQWEGVRSWRSCTSRRWNRIRLSTPRCRSWGTTRLLLRPSCSSFEKFETRFSSPLLPLSTSVRIRVPRSSSVEFRAKC